MNVCAFVGRLGADPELRSTKSGMSVLELRIAVDVRVKRGEEWVKETSWLRTTVFGRRAESLAKMLRRGEQVGVTGSLLVREYDKRDGSGKGTSVEVVNADVHLVGNREGGGGGGGGGGARRPEKPRGGSGDYAELEDDFGEIPF